MLFFNIFTLGLRVHKQVCILTFKHMGMILRVKLHIDNLLLTLKSNNINIMMINSKLTVDYSVKHPRYLCYTYIRSMKNIEVRGHKIVIQLVFTQKYADLRSRPVVCDISSSRSQLPFIFKNKLIIIFFHFFFLVKLSKCKNKHLIK